MHDPGDASATHDQPERLAGTVKFYQRHVFVCTGSTDWPAHIEADGGFCQDLAGAIAAAALPQVVKLNACDEPSRGHGYDLLVFPDMVRYLGVESTDIPVFVAECLAGSQAGARLAYEPISGRHLFVCVHQARDPRCGGCGPALAASLTRELAEHQLSAAVHVHRTSHVGGHQFAANLLIYPGGDWYGHLQASDAPALINQHVLAGQIIPPLWRGRMGLQPSEQVPTF